MSSEILSPRVLELLEESRLKVLAAEEALRLDLPAGEIVTGLVRMQAARALALSEGDDPNDADVFSAAYERVPELDNDLTTIPEAAPDVDEDEAVVGAFNRRVRAHLTERGLDPDNDSNYRLAVDVLTGGEAR